MNGNNEKKNSAGSGLFETIKDENKKDIVEMLHFTYEAQIFRMDEYIKKLFVLCLVLIILLFGTNVAWFAYKTNVKTVDTSRSRELDNTGKMIALKPIYYTTDYKDDIEIIYQSDSVGDNKAERSRKKAFLYCFNDLAIAC